MATTSSSPIRYCSQCGRAAPEEDLARFGDQMVCATCKPAYTQKLREGVAPLAVGVADTGYQYGGFWIRVVAQLIDSIILGMVLSAVQYALIFPLIGLKPFIQPGRTDPLQVLPAMFAIMGVSVLVSYAGGSSYEGFFVSRLGATPGKMVFSMKVVRPDGRPLAFGRAFGRFFAKQVSTLTFCIGYVMVAFDGEKRGLHDMICDTRVVRPVDLATPTLS
jgi:uncharacterized RDD family membrane protein YckC